MWTSVFRIDYKHTHTHCKSTCFYKMQTKKKMFLFSVYKGKNNKKQESTWIFFLVFYFVTYTYPVLIFIWRSLWVHILYNSNRNLPVCFVIVLKVSWMYIFMYFILVTKKCSVLFCYACRAALCKYRRVHYKAFCVFCGCINTKYKSENRSMGQDR